MEERLDSISNGHADWKKGLGYFWAPFFNIVNSVKQMTHDDIFSGITDLEVGWFCSEKGNEEIGKKKYPNCFGGILKLNFGKAGVFLGCSNYPICNHTKDIMGSNDNSEYPKSLGIDGDRSRDNDKKKGPFGLYLEFNSESEKKKKIVYQKI